MQAAFATPLGLRSGGPPFEVSLTRKRIHATNFRSPTCCVSSTAQLASHRRARRESNSTHDETNLTQSRVLSRVHTLRNANTRPERRNLELDLSSMTQYAAPPPSAPHTLSPRGAGPYTTDRQAETVRGVASAPATAVLANGTETFVRHLDTSKTTSDVKQTSDRSHNRQSATAYTETRPRQSRGAVVLPPMRYRIESRTVPSEEVARWSRCAKPVPKPEPHEIMPRRRGRNSLRRIEEAEHFRRYMVLRRQLKPWSDDFRSIHGRTPTLADVHKTGVPGLLERFLEYLDALDGLRS